jgi:hypothetical protein
MRVMKVSRPGSRCGSSRSMIRSDVVGVGLGRELDPDRVADPGDEVDVGAVDLAGALPDPDEVSGRVIGQPRPRVDPRQRPFVVEQERFVRGEELGRAHRIEVRATGAMNFIALSMSWASRS